MMVPLEQSKSMQMYESQLILPNLFFIYNWTLLQFLAYSEQSIKLENYAVWSK